jgi:TatA/E family protein of Tat protein translocase
VPNIGLPEIAMVLVIALIVFGPKRLPDMGRQLGKTIREFRDATSDIRSQIGINDIADSVKDIKSGLSLTSTGTAAGAAATVIEPAVVESPAGAVGADMPRADAHEAGQPAAARSPNGPVAAGEPAVAPVLGNGPVAAAPAPPESSAAGSPAADAGLPGGGVEAFGKLTRRASSSVRPTAG